MATDTIPHRLLEQSRRRPHGPAYYEKQNGRWVATSWRNYADSVRRCARALIAIGFERRDTVAILGFNCAEWVILDHAAMAAGGAPAGIYTTCSPSEIEYIVGHAESKVLWVESLAQWKKVETQLGNLPKLKHVVFKSGVKKPDTHRELCLTWEELLEKGNAVPEGKLDERLEALEPNDLATLIYTSGTTGPPKGVMLSHRNLAWTASVAKQLANGSPYDYGLSYLPLSHIAEQMFTIHLPATVGGQVFFAESSEKLAENLREVQPTIVFGVPRIWEKLQSGIAGKLGEAKGAKKAIADWAQKVGRQVIALRARGEEPRGALAAQHALANKLVYKKVKEAIGLSEARFCVSGAAPVARETLEFLAGFDITVLEVYGQSEGTGPTTFNQATRFKFGSVGPAIPGAEVKIADDGEILLRGPNVFLGYYKEPEATAAILKDGWLYSGDLGELDPQGFLSITGRKKEIIITAGGKNIAPKNIEGALKNNPLINEAVVIGDRRKFLTVLVTLDPERLTVFAKEHGIDPNAAHDHDAVRGEIQRALDEVNRDLARVEQVKKFQVLPRNLSIEHGELTPTLKVKRNVVSKNFAPQIEAMYAE